MSPRPPENGGPMHPTLPPCRPLVKNLEKVRSRYGWIGLHDGLGIADRLLRRNYSEELPELPLLETVGMEYGEM